MSSALRHISVLHGGGTAQVAGSYNSLFVYASPYCLAEYSRSHLSEIASLRLQVEDSVSLLDQLSPVRIDIGSRVS